MTPFSYQRPDSLAAAADRVDASRLAYAGGTDLLPRIKLGLEQPRELVDLKRSGISDEIVDHGDRITVGGLVTLARIEREPLLAERLAALPAAARQAATPQIRNRATIAGNLLQRPRCWYYRTPEVDCWLSGGDHCPARDGRNEHHAIFHDSPCVAVHPSDLAGSLLALDAAVTIRAADGERALPLAELYAPPVDERRTETVLDPGDIVTAIDVDTTRPIVSTYRKAMDRAAWAFALVGVAVVARRDGDELRDIRIVLTGVANTPRRALDSEETLALAPFDPASVDRAAELAVAGAEPLNGNRYKQQLAIAMTRDAITAVLDQARR